MRGGGGARYVRAASCIDSVHRGVVAAKSESELWCVSQAEMEGEVECEGKIVENGGVAFDIAN